MKFRALLLAALLVAGPVAAQTAASLPANLTWRTPDPENVVVVETTKGVIIAELYPTAAPATVARVKILVRQKFYDGDEFFRVIEGFMDQTGDPKNTGQGGSTLPDLTAEFSFRRGPDAPLTPVATSKPNTALLGVLPMGGQPDAMMDLTVDGKAQSTGLFCAGVLGMARAGDPNSGNSQFFFMRGQSSGIDGNYTAFGRVLSGMDAVRSIKVGEPVQPPRDRMTRVRMLADIPVAERPKVQAMDTASPAFKAYVEGLRAKAGGFLDICDIPLSAP